MLTRRPHGDEEISHLGAISGHVLFGVLNFLTIEDLLALRTVTKAWREALPLPVSLGHPVFIGTLWPRFAQDLINIQRQVRSDRRAAMTIIRNPVFAHALESSSTVRDSVIGSLHHDELAQVVAMPEISSTTPLLHYSLETQHQRVQGWNNDRLWGCKIITCIGVTGALMLGLGIAMLVSFARDPEGQATSACFALTGLACLLAAAYCIRKDRRLKSNLGGVGLIAREHSVRTETEWTGNEVPIPYGFI